MDRTQGRQAHSTVPRWPSLASACCPNKRFRGWTRAKHLASSCFAQEKHPCKISHNHRFPICTFTCYYLARENRKALQTSGLAGHGCRLNHVWAFQPNALSVKHSRPVQGRRSRCGPRPAQTLGWDSDLRKIARLGSLSTGLQCREIVLPTWRLLCSEVYTWMESRASRLKVLSPYTRRSWTLAESHPSLLASPTPCCRLVMQYLTFVRPRLVRAFHSHLVHHARLCLERSSRQGQVLRFSGGGAIYFLFLVLLRRRCLCILCIVQRRLIHRRAFFEAQLLAMVAISSNVVDFLPRRLVPSPVSIFAFPLLLCQEGA